MNSAIGNRQSTIPPPASVDAEHPWLGLVSFTEETRGFFHGREEEVAELGRRVQRKLLTVLFGQSGLGKTSILQAGLVPRLRPEGFCPVYVRLDYDPHSPPPAEQIKRAVFRATGAAGTWTQSGSAVAGESLWEFLHHRDDVLRDAAGRTLIPLLIFDQFEEIFTLAQADDAGRRRAQEFLGDLADLVENRPPAALEARIERDEADAAKFDFARADYRILLSLREDYLAHLEALKNRMPSVTQNRMRLARMTGAQALAAVRRPAPQLVNDEVAAAIVRFVAGGAEAATAEVEPSLLSLICRELNNTRLARGEREISAGLLAGSRDTILTEFYERTLADQPPGVRVFIEDEMLTDSGFRESVAEERVRKGFAAAGAAAEALAALVDRRLLRVEDRLDLRRVEITHDVLCGVIAGSRAVRREREALEESQRLLAAEREREQATRRALMRARAVAAVASVLMLFAAGSAVFGWVNLRRARAAETDARQSRGLAETARTEAEKLVGYLLEDFYEELKPTGRVETIGGLIDKAVAYYDGLPPGLVNDQTRLYRGMALARKAAALNDAGRSGEALNLSTEAQRIFAALRAAGVQGDDLAVAEAQAIFAVVSPGGLGQTRADLQRGIALLRPLQAAGRASRSARLLLADMLQFLAHTEPKAEDGIALCEESRSILAGMGALDLSDLTVAAVYGDVTDTQSRMALNLGRLDEAAQLAGIVQEMAEKVLAKRPGDLRAMQNRHFAANMRGQVAQARHDLAAAEAAQQEAVEAARDYTRFNPADSVGWQNYGSDLRDLALNYLSQGRVADGRRKLQESADVERNPLKRSGMSPSTYWSWLTIVRVEALQGNVRSARAALDECRRVGSAVIKDRGIDEELGRITGLGTDLLECEVRAAEGDWAGAHARAAEVADQLGRLEIQIAGNVDFRTNTLRLSRIWQIEAGLRTGRPEEAATLARELLAQPLYGRRVDRRTMDDGNARNRVRLGEALLALGRRDEALAALGDAEAHFRARRAEGAGTTEFRVDFARALLRLAEAQGRDAAGRGRRVVLLDEAMSVLGGLSLEAQQLRHSRELLDWVGRARRETDRS